MAYKRNSGLCGCGNIYEDDKNILAKDEAPKAAPKAEVKKEQSVGEMMDDAYTKLGFTNAENA